MRSWRHELAANSLSEIDKVMKKQYQKPNMVMDVVGVVKIVCSTTLDTTGPQIDPTPAPWRY